jgi:hypothetical protein
MQSAEFHWRMQIAECIGEWRMANEIQRQRRSQPAETAVCPSASPRARSMRIEPAPGKARRNPIPASI